MSNVNDFLPFCATDTGTNLLSQSAYVAAANRPIGNQPGIASSQLVNKSVRQPTYVVSQLAQYISNQANVSVLDDAVPAKLLSQIMGTFQPLSPILTKYLTGSGTWNATYYFFIASGNATVGATYTNNAITFTVSKTIAAGVVLQVTGNGDPTAGGGVLTKASGTGDATITFYAFRKSLYLKVLAVGAGGGGGAQNAGTDGGAGSDTTFGTSLIVAGGGGGGHNGTVPTGAGGVGGTAALGSGPVGLAIPGGSGSGAGNLTGVNAQIQGGSGGNSILGGGGGGAGASGTGNAQPGATNSGGGGGGGDASSTGGAGGGGGGGGGVEALIFAPLSSYGWVIGAGGSAGAGGGGGAVGADGIIQVVELFQ